MTVQELATKLQTLARAIQRAREDHDDKLGELEARQRELSDELKKLADAKPPRGAKPDDDDD